jgi:hypothetical protein
MFGKIYEHILFLREDLIEFFLEKIPTVFSENWWEKAVINTFTAINYNTKAHYERLKLALELRDSCSYTFTGFDFSALLDILIYNWQDIISHQSNNTATDKNINLFYKLKAIRNDISHANDDKLNREDFTKYITYLSRFATIINSTKITPEILNKYISPPPFTNDEDDKKTKIIQLIESHVIEPALECKNISEDIKESIVRSLIKLEISGSLEALDAFFSGALLSPRGQSVCNELHKNNLKAFEDIKTEYTEIFYS